ncbi:hypothetical protein MMC25_006905 [Agyrium rufum]|nr:hypothetical protein [Agyrium rufum]
MASGFGLDGGPSRCFPFWQELLACYVVNTTSDDVSGAKKCVPAMEDFFECLHHKKEAERVANMQKAYRQQIRTHPQREVPVGALRNLGLLGKDEDSKLVLGSGLSSEKK